MTEVGGNIGQAAEIAGRLLANVETVVHGKTDEVRLVLAALVCDGHVLLEDVPGTAKTVLARAIAGSVEGASFARIQCTPDLQPTDVTGLSVFNQRDRDFEFRPGPVFANVLLVDEINRAMPKTQSALLEAMAEYQATIDGVTRELPKPFLVLATENPIEQEGTFPLPEAQLDRFLLRTALGYPGEEEELRIVEEQVVKHPLSGLAPVLSLDEVNVLREAAHGVYVDPLLRRWAIRLVRATREAEGIAIGASVRGSLALERSARAWALLSGREFVTTVDIERLFLPVVMHRIVFTPSFVATAREIGWQEAADGFHASVSRSRRSPGSSSSRPFLHEVVALAGLGQRSHAASPQRRARAVTLPVRQYTNANKVRVLVWYGQVSGGGGELVEVQARDCGTKAFYKVAETKPSPGGGWEIQSQNPDPPYGSVRWSAAQTYRARWGDQLSEPVAGLRFALRPWVEKVSRQRAWRVRVNHNGLPLHLKLDGKLVVLQRKRGESWSRYKQALLKEKPSLEDGAYNHEAVFDVPTRGLTLRAFVPAKTAGQCWLPGASDPWRS